MAVEIKNIDIMGDDIFWIDNVVPIHMLMNWWSDLQNYGKWDKGFLAYGGNPPHPSMDKSGDPEHIKRVRELGSFSTDITGTKERVTWYMNVSRSKEHFQNAATTAYKKTDDGNEPYWEDPKTEESSFALQDHQFEHHPKIHNLVDQIWAMYKPFFEDAIGKEVQDYNNCYLHAFQTGDSSWTHQDYMDYSAIVYLNPPIKHHWDLRKWGGETLYWNDELDFIRACTVPKGGAASLFKGDIFHKVTMPSWEADFARNAATFFFDKK